MKLRRQKVFFKQLGYNDIKVGDKVTVPVRRNGTEPFRKYEFVISGIMKDGVGNESQQSSTVFVSKKYYDSIVSDGEERYTAYFTFNETIKAIPMKSKRR